jgi:hypothetical protein
MSRFAVEAVASTGKRTGPAFVSRADGSCSYEDLTVPTYPPSPRGELFRAHRVALGVSLRQAADALGLSAVEVSGLEFGRYVFADAADWDRAESFLQSRSRRA